LLIQFPPGAGGHFLGYFLSKRNIKALARIDPPGFIDQPKGTIWQPDGCDVKLTHDMNKDLGGLRIVPITNIYGYLKTRWFKKEGGDLQRTHLPFEMDTFIHFHYIEAKSLDTRDCFDYGNIWNIEKLSTLYDGVVPAQKIQFAKEYASKNYWIDTILNPADIFDLCIKIHQYETNNNLINVDRIWSIDDMPTNLEDAIEFFEDNKYRYDL